MFFFLIILSISLQIATWHMIQITKFQVEVRTFSEIFNSLFLPWITNFIPK